MSDVFIDHCNEETGTLVEAKGRYYKKNSWEFTRPIFQAEWLKQANRQLKVARLYGRQLEWWFNEEEAMEAARAIFKKNGFEDIILKHVPYPGTGQ